jgi:transposase IS116/IS110/IS902 family protein
MSPHSPGPGGASIYRRVPLTAGSATHKTPKLEGHVSAPDSAGIPESECFAIRSIVSPHLGRGRAHIAALTAVGAAAILAEAGDPRRYDSSSSLVKHAGLSPSENASGAFNGQARISRRGRPGLQLTVWRAVWPMLQFNPVMAAKYQAMTQAGGTAGDAAARALRAKARVACAASLLRWIYSMTAHDTSWDAAVAAGRKDTQDAPAWWRQPDQRSHPARSRCGRLRPSSSMRGRASPSRRRGPTPYDTLGSPPPVARCFSPARLNAVGAGHPPHGQAEPACTT